jgi:hypothetical protein
VKSSFVVFISSSFFSFFSFLGTNNIQYWQRFQSSCYFFFRCKHLVKCTDLSVLRCQLETNLKVHKKEEKNQVVSTTTAVVYVVCGIIHSRFQWHRKKARERKKKEKKKEREKRRRKQQKEISVELEMDENLLPAGEQSRRNKFMQIMGDIK